MLGIHLNGIRNVNSRQRPPKLRIEYWYSCFRIFFTCHPSHTRPWDDHEKHGSKEFEGEKNEMVIVKTEKVDNWTTDWVFLFQCPFSMLCSHVFRGGSWTSLTRSQGMLSNYVPICGPEWLLPLQVLAWKYLVTVEVEPKQKGFLYCNVVIQ